MREVRGVVAWCHPVRVRSPGRIFIVMQFRFPLSLHLSLTKSLASGPEQEPNLQGDHKNYKYKSLSCITEWTGVRISVCRTQILAALDKVTTIVICVRAAGCRLEG